MNRKKGMKNSTRILLSVLLIALVLTVLPAVAYSEEDGKDLNGEFEYVLNEQEQSAGISKYTGTASEVVIPATIEDYPVRYIYSEAFAECDFVTDITIPDTVTFIGNNAFNDTAFYKNPENWENGVFYLGKILYEADPAYEGECIVKEGTETISPYAFARRSKLTKLTIPGSVKILPIMSFIRCVELTDLTVEEGAEIIKEKAFQGCTKLENISLPKSLKQIGKDVFNGTAYYNDESNWENNGLYLDHILLTIRSDHDGEFTVREGTSLIADAAFLGGSITSVSFPEGLKRIPDYAFNMCMNLKEFHFNEDLEEFGADWLPYNDLMKTFVMPAGIRKLAARAFAFNTFTEITLNENLKEIGAEAFVSSENLKEITVPKNVEYIGDNAFGYIANTTLEGYTLEKVEDFVIKGYAGSLAEAYAKQHGFKFVDVSKISNPLKVKANKVIVKYAKLKKKNLTIAAKKAFTVSSAKGKVTYKVVTYDSKAKKKITVSSAGKVTVKKGLKEGTYKLKVKVTAKGNSTYKAKSKTVTLKVVVR